MKSLRLKAQIYVKETDSYTLFVHPKTEPDMSFRVIKWKKAGNELIDDYVQTRRYLQAKKYFKPFADSISERHLISAAVVSILDKKEYWDMQYSIENLIKMYNKDITVGMDIFYFFDLHEWNKEDVCKNVYNLIKHIQDSGIGKLNLSIQFYDEDFFKYKDVVKINKEEMGSAGMMNFISHYGEYMKNSIEVDERFPINKIKSYKDIENLIWYRQDTGKKDNIGGEIYEWVQK